MKSKIFRLKTHNDQYPYEIEIWNPSSTDPMPSWFSDILQLKYFNEHGQPEFNYTRDNKGNFNYYIPATNSHLKVDVSSIVARDIHNGTVRPLRISVLSTIYELKINRCDYIVHRMKIALAAMRQVIRNIHGVMKATLTSISSGH